MIDRVTIDPFGPEIAAFVANMRRQERSEKTAGEDPLTVATFLGHKNLATLNVYAQIPEATRARATAMMNRYLEAG